jgi:hypothetical protein
MKENIEDLKNTIEDLKYQLKGRDETINTLEQIMIKEGVINKDILECYHGYYSQEEAWCDMCGYTFKEPQLIYFYIDEYENIKNGFLNENEIIEKEKSILENFTNIDDYLDDYEDFLNNLTINKKKEKNNE